MIMIEVVLAAKPGEEAALVDLFRRTAAASQAESGCLTYRFTRDLDDGGFHLLEQWEDDAAIRAHLAGPAFKAFIAELPERGIVVSSRWRSGTFEPYDRPGTTSS